MSEAPSKSRLPRQVDPRKFAHQGLTLEGVVAVRELSRLAKIALSDTEVVSVALQFDVDEEKRRVITGEASCTLPVTCQRCLEPVDVAIKAEFHLAIVWDEDAAKQLPRALDPLIIGEGQTDIYTVIEDELLLNLPMASYHDYDCVGQTSYGDEPQDDEGSTNNPFQVLEQLKGSPKS